MPLSLWGLDEARKNFNKRVDDTGAAAWNTARGRKPNPDDTAPVRRTSTSTTSSTSTAPAKRDFLPPPRKLSQQEIPPPPKTPSTKVYVEAKTKRPPPPPLPSREGSSVAPVTPALPRHSTSSAVSSVQSESSSIRPSALLNQAPSFPAAIKRNDGQDGVTNELAEKLAKMRTRTISPERQLPSNAPNTTNAPTTPKVRSTETVPKVGSRPIPPKPVSPRPPAPLGATKPVLPPRTTPAPPSIPALKPAPQSFKPIPLPYQAPSLHRAILPGFSYPAPDASCHSPGLDKFNRVFPRPSWEVEQASLFILATLYPSDSTYTFTPKTLEQPIQLIMRDMGGNAHAENSSVTIAHGRKKEIKYRSNIVFSTRNLTQVAKRHDAGFVEEVRGVIVHELTHSWQWDCDNMPGGLTEGIPLAFTGTYGRNCGFCEIESWISARSLESFARGEELGLWLRNYCIFP